MTARVLACTLLLAAAGGAASGPGDTAAPEVIAVFHRRRIESNHAAAIALACGFACVAALSCVICGGSAFLARRRAHADGGQFKPRGPSPPEIPPGKYDDVTGAPDHFVCPITQSVMTDPVLCVDRRHSFERLHLERFLLVSKTGSCPVSRAAMTRDDIKPNGALRAEIDAWVLAASGGSDCGSRAATEPEEDEQVAVEMDPPGLVPAGSEGGSAAEPHGPPGARALRPGSGGGGGSEGREESAGGVPNEPFGQSRGARRHRLGTLVAAGFVDGGECGARTSDCTSSASDGTSSVPVDSASPSECALDVE